MKRLIALGCFILASLPMIAVESISGWTLDDEMELVDSHLEQIDRQIEQIRKDLEVNLPGFYKSAWVRVLDIGRRLDEARSILREHPQKIAKWDILLNVTSRKDTKKKAYQQRFDRHAQLNRIWIPIEEEVGQKLGADFAYIRAAIRSLKELHEKTGDEKWAKLAEEIEGYLNAGDFIRATRAIQAVAGDLPESQLSSDDWAVLQAGPRISNAETEGADERSGIAGGDGNLQRWIRYLEKACEETNDPELCEQADRLRKLVSQGNVEAAQELTRKAKRYMNDKGLVVTGMPDVEGESPNNADIREVPRDVPAVPKIPRPTLNKEMKFEIDGKTYYLPGGWDQPGYLAEYTGGAAGERLVKETMIRVEWQKVEGQAHMPVPNEVEVIEWSFDIPENDQVTIDGDAYLPLKLVDNNGRSTFTVTKWEVWNRAMTDLKHEESARDIELRMKDFSGPVIIIAHGKTEWGNPFKIKTIYFFPDRS